MTTARKRLIQDPERVNPVESVHIWRTPAGSPVEMLIVAHLSAYSDIHRQSISSLPNETGGFLVGRVACDQRGCWHVEIEQAVPVEPVTQNPVHFTFTWKDVDRVRSYREEHGKALLGWYHTHPDLGIFLSETDLERTHRVLFSEPFQIALVYDPVRGRAGYFFWDGAQQINASKAEWREFDILVAPDPTAVSGQSIPVVSSPVLQAATPAPVASSAIPPAAASSMPAPLSATPAPGAVPAVFARDDDTPAVPQPVVPGPIRPLPTRPHVPESEIPTAPGFPAINPAAIAREGSRLVQAASPEVTRTQRLRQPETHIAADLTPRRSSLPTPPIRPAPVRTVPVSDRSTDVAARPRTALLIGGVLILIAVVTLILWMSAS